MPRSLSTSTTFSGWAGGGPPACCWAPCFFVTGQAANISAAASAAVVRSGRKLLVILLYTPRSRVVAGSSGCTNIRTGMVLYLSPQAWFAGVLWADADCAAGKSNQERLSGNERTKGKTGEDQPPQIQEDAQADALQEEEQVAQGAPGAHSSLPWRRTARHRSCTPGCPEFQVSGSVRRSSPESLLTTPSPRSPRAMPPVRFPAGRRPGVRGSAQADPVSFDAPLRRCAAPTQT